MKRYLLFIAILLSLRAESFGQQAKGQSLLTHPTTGEIQPTTYKATFISGNGLETATATNGFFLDPSTNPSFNAGNWRSDLGLVIGTDVQAYSANLAAWSGKTPYAGSLVITTGKTPEIQNTLIFTGTDGSTLNIGTGGTLGTGAYSTIGTTGATVPLLNSNATVSGTWAFEGTGSHAFRPTTNQINLGSDSGASTITSSTAKAGYIGAYRFGSTTTSRIIAWSSPSTDAGTLYLGGHVGTAARSAQSVVIATDPSESSTGPAVARATFSDTAATVIPPTTFSGNITGNGTNNTLPNQTIPLTGTDSIATRASVDEREYSPTKMVFRDEFVGGGSTNGNIGDIGWWLHNGSGFVAPPSPVAASPYVNQGLKELITGSTSGNAQTMYLGTKLFFLNTTNWNIVYTFSLRQTTSCDLIVGATADASNIGASTWGNICFGLRYSTDVSDANFKFFSKNTATDWSAGGSLSTVDTGVAVNTSYHTFEMRSVASVVTMRLDGGAWTSITMNPSTGQGFLPFMYISTRAAATKSVYFDFFSYSQTGLSR